MISQIARLSLLSAVALAVTACEVRLVDDTIRDVATYYDDARRTPENGDPVPLSGTYSEAFDRVLANLRAKSFQVVTADAANGLIIARSTDRKLLACGELQSGPLGVAAPYDANAPVAIIEVPGEGAGATFVRREFSSASEIRIQITADPEQDGAIFGSISEIHNATIRLTQLSDNVVIYNETIAFDGVNRGRFNRGVVCGSARAMRSIIQRT